MSDVTSLSGSADSLNGAIAANPGHAIEQAGGQKMGAARIVGGMEASRAENRRLPGSRAADHLLFRVAGPVRDCDAPDLGPADAQAWSAARMGVRCRTAASTRWRRRANSFSDATKTQVLILGVSCYFHDAAAALLRDGQLVAAAEEERFSRKKHDFDFPENAIEFCLQTAGIQAADLDYLVFFEKPFLKFERLLLTSMQTFPRSLKVFREAMLTWLGDKIWIRHLIQNKLGLPAKQDPLQRASPVPCRQFLFVLALRRGGDPDHRRGRRVDHGQYRGRQGHRGAAAQGDSLSPFAGSALQRVHRLFGLRGERGRVQGDGDGAVRRARLRGPGQEADPAR